MVPLLRHSISYYCSFIISTFFSFLHSNSLLFFDSSFFDPSIVQFSTHSYFLSFIHPSIFLSFYYSLILLPFVLLSFSTSSLLLIYTRSTFFILSSSFRIYILFCYNFTLPSLNPSIFPFLFYKFHPSNLSSYQFHPFTLFSNFPFILLLFFNLSTLPPFCPSVILVSFHHFIKLSFYYYYPSINFCSSSPSILSSFCPSVILLPFHHFILLSSYLSFIYIFLL
jgi:hypothetical protein